jgi:hypothetical protein
MPGPIPEPHTQEIWMMRRTLIATLTMLALVAGAARADRESSPGTDIGFRGWGPRLGVSINPDQIHFGAHLDFGNFAEHVRFQPNFEMGFGDHLMLTTLNAEAAYRFRSTWDVWTPYLGGGLGMNIARQDGGNHATDTSLGVNLLGGIERGISDGDRFFVEGKFSLNDAPDAKITVGWTFYH